MTEKEELERQVAQCRRLARSVTDEKAVEALTRLADELEARLKDMASGGERSEGPSASG